ncbi:hypothetical protein ACWCQN_08750 [Streptomyces sp. NPDC001984]
MARHQGTLFFVMLPLSTLKLHVDAITAVFGRTTPVLRRAVEAPLLALRLAGFAGGAFVVLPPQKALPYLAVELAVSSFYLRACFAPNYIGMPMAGADTSLDFLRRQVLMSRNIRGGVDGPRHGRTRPPDRTPPLPRHAQPQPPSRGTPGP